MLFLFANRLRPTPNLPRQAKQRMANYFLFCKAKSAVFAKLWAKKRKRPTCRGRESGGSKVEYLDCIPASSCQKKKNNKGKKNRSFPMARKKKSCNKVKVMQAYQNILSI